MNEINLLEKTAGDLKSIQGLNNTQDTHTHAECYHIFSFKWRRKPSEMRGRNQRTSGAVWSKTSVSLLLIFCSFTIQSIIKKDWKVRRQDHLDCRCLFLPAMVEIPRVTPIESSICVPWRTDDNRREQTRTDENRLSGGKRDGIYNDGDLRVIPLKLNFMAV